MSEIEKRIDGLALAIEHEIEKTATFIEGLPEFDKRRKSNTYQLKKVLDGDMEAVEH